MSMQYTRDNPVIDSGVSMTKQSFRDETDINKIVARFEKTGMVEHLNKAQPFYGDVSALRGYHEALNVVSEAQSLFMGLSAQVRERFDNDASKLIVFLDDSKNLEEAVELGIVTRKPEPAAVVPAVNPAPVVVPVVNP